MDRDSSQNYEIIRKVGSGAFGEVYEAIDLSNSKTPPSRVAIKIIPKANLNTHTRRQRIAREVVLHSRFRSNPSFLKLRSYFEDLSRVYIVTELCPNGNLLRYLECHPDGLPEDQVRGLMQDIVNGIQQLHVQGIMHRDLKLSNILLDKHMRTKIADFGLARIIEDSKSEDEFTFCGTPNYISPEILAEKPYGLSSDIWSLGCIFLTLLTGNPPFAGAEIEDVLNRVMRGKYDIPRRISRDARTLVQTMLERNPAYRISTFEILKDRFFDGPICLLPPVPADGFAVADESSVHEKTGDQDRILPRMRDIQRKPRSRRRFPKTAVSTDHDEDKGFRTMLEEIRVPSKSQRKRSAEKAPIPYESIRPSENREPRRSRNHVVSHQSAEINRASFGSFRDSNRHVSGGSTSKDSCSGKKEAMFEVYESDDVEPAIEPETVPRPSRLGNPSPGEGLRNALENLENRLHRKQSNGQTQLDHSKGGNKSQKSSSEKGFATLVEELVEPQRSQKENMEPTRKRRSPTDLQRGLLSLLSNLNQRKQPKPHDPRERHISPLPRPSEHESASYTPILPSRQSDLSEYSTFLAKYKFSTAGIPPLTQHTKHGIVKIDPKGNIELHIPSISRYTFSISSDSTLVTVTDRGRIVWQGDVDALPWRWTRVFRYASRFVGICRARIPKVSVEVGGVRARVMLNGDFEGCNIQQGILIRRGAKQRAVKVFALDDDVEELQWEGDLSEIPNEWEDLLRSSVELYSRFRALGDDARPDEESDDTARCIPGVGWCSTRGSKVQLLLFKDGVRIDVNVETGELVYCSKNQRKEKWALHHGRLPTYITEKLELCRAFADVE